MGETGWMFCFFYIVFATGFVFQFKDFQALGLSPEGLLTAVFQMDLGSEQLQFLEFNLRKSCGALLLQTFLPIGFMLGFSYFHVHVDQEQPSIYAFWEGNLLFQISLAVFLGLWLLVWTVAQYWTLNDFENHPYVTKLKLYAQNGDWKSVMSDINTEFRRIDKFTICTNPIERVVVTDNWVIFLGAVPWKFHIAHQSDVTLNLIGSEHHHISTEGQAGGTQFLKIEVQNGKPNCESFSFRLNSLEYQNLQDKLTRQIQNIQNIQIFKTVGDRFVEVFREAVAQNPKAPAEEDLEACIGCMATQANVKLIRRCDPVDQDDERSTACVNCYCRPMWCLNCLGKWFASRQNQQQPETWLGSKCPCPTCRSRFCLLDVALIEP